MFTAEDVAFFVVEVMALQDVGMLSKPLDITKLTTVEYGLLDQIVERIRRKAIGHVHDS